MSQWRLQLPYGGSHSMDDTRQAATVIENNYQHYVQKYSIFNIMYVLILVARSTNSENRARAENTSPSALIYIPRLLSTVSPFSISNRKAIKRFMLRIIINNVTMQPVYAIINIPNQNMDCS